MNIEKVYQMEFGKNLSIAGKQSDQKREDVRMRSIQ